MGKFIKKNAILIVGFSAFCLMLLKLVVAIISGSMAVMASAIDSMLDMFVSLFNHFTYKKSQSPSTQLFNYGFGKLEGLAAVFEGILICVSGIYIIYQSIHKFIVKSPIESVEQSIFIMLVSILATFCIVLFLKYIVKSNHSIIIKTEILHYSTDLFSNLAVILSLVLVYATSIFAIDSALGLVLGIYICIQSKKIAQDGFLILLDRAIDENLHNKIVAILSQDRHITSYHHLKSRQSGKHIFLEYHLVFDSEISLLNAHNISDKIESEIKQISSDYEWIILTHLDPYDDSSVESK